MPAVSSTRLVSYRRFAADLDHLLRDAGIVSHRRRNWVTAGAEPSGRMRRVQDYVERHVGEVGGLDELAEVAGLSRYHFARVFRKEVGLPPWTFVRRVRTRHALDLLRRGRSPAEAAHEAGFADQSHLTRTLRALDGRTPGRIARDASEDEGSEGLDRETSGSTEHSKNVQDG